LLIVASAGLANRGHLRGLAEDYRAEGKILPIVSSSSPSTYLGLALRGGTRDLFSGTLGTAKIPSSRIRRS
jgi:hypothetical protein